MISTLRDSCTSSFTRRGSSVLGARDWTLDTLEAVVLRTIGKIWVEVIHAANGTLDDQ